MKTPKLGMHYEDVRSRVNRIRRTKWADEQRAVRLTSSLINQAELHQKGSRVELLNEIEHNRTSFSGSGNSQIGIGPGKRLGTGKWTWQDGKWIKV